MAQPNPSANPNFNRSLDYLKQVQETFDAQSETYQQFLKILRDYYDAFRSDIEDVVAKHKAAKEAGTADPAKQDAAVAPVESAEDVSKKRNERTQQALEDVKKLFAGHDDLIQGFQAFLPQNGSAP
ncbi:hypothetical protein JX265_007921 [Neoarthrinium moseri]|uniref:Uncharacterized protein n=1 Tax=Neoarthrinium moseri TaxID=1658444 RepID=A0A9Q0AKF5_9PEZI|nr:hypothetical protein JX266_012473 [Neoarthrinium moseri]KAI1865598.1 hypothetical protein JX265_007921 [Neoarthrinium moseri]